MSDELVSALLKDADLRVVLVTTGALSRHAQQLQQLESAAAALLAQGLTAAALLAALQKEQGRINLQLECDGPLRGMFADGGPEGAVRGYVKNPHVRFAGAEGRYRWRPVLGNAGYLSVLRDLGGGEYYRSSVELAAFDFPRDLERFFAASEQTETVLAIEEAAAEVDGRPEALGQVAGVLLQPLPDGDRELFQALARELPERFARAVREAPHEGAAALLRRLFEGREDLEVMSRYPLAFRCGCSRERVHRALLSMGRAELEDVLAKDGKAEVTCEFCTTQYVVTEDELRGLLAQTDA